tara:strand:+ start:381 stop:1022 length:642 start_codon:yes stop_codon:yes gene_type:complete
MAKEFERKFVAVDTNDVHVIIANHSKPENIVKIEQSYIVSQYANLSFNEVGQNWDIKLNLKDGTVTGFSANITAEELDEVYEVLKQSTTSNLLDVKKMSSRVRFKGGKTLFTAKFKPFYEFEPEIMLELSMKDILLRYLPSVTKFRHAIVLNGQDVELDVFCAGVSEPIFEVEFETEEEMNTFDPAVFGIKVKEVTNDNSYKNKYIAIRNFEK